MLLAQPWWVNLLILIPVVSFYFWRRKGLAIEWKTLVAAAAFAAAFGFVEAACVDYLRGNVSSLQSLSIQPSDIANPQALHILPDRLLKTETFREARFSSSRICRPASHPSSAMLSTTSTPSRRRT